VTVYEASGAGGGLEPRWPCVGPCAAEDERPCRLRRSHKRARKTGPGEKLQVASCGVHGRGFTLYPPGHVPYGRRPVAPVASDGAPIARTPERWSPPSGEPAARCPAVRRFEGTWFETAIDAADGRAWPRGSPGASELRWETQRRALVRQAAWLGVAADWGQDAESPHFQDLEDPHLPGHEQTRTCFASGGRAECSPDVERDGDERRARGCACAGVGVAS